MILGYAALALWIGFAAAMIVRWLRDRRKNR